MQRRDRSQPVAQSLRGCKDLSRDREGVVIVQDLVPLPDGHGSKSSQPRSDSSTFYDFDCLTFAPNGLVPLVKQMVG